MAARMKDALAEAGITPESVAPADAPAPESEPADTNVSIGTAAREQNGLGVKHFTLAPDAGWVTFAGGKVGVTIGRNDCRQISYVPEPGRDAHIPLWVLAEAFAGGAITA